MAFDQSKIFTTNASLMQIVRERRFLLLSIGSGILMFTLTFSTLIPRIQEMLAAKDALDEKQASLTRFQNKVRFLQSFQAEDFNQQNGRMNQILPSGKPFLSLLFSLEKIASEHQVVFSGLDISPGEIASGSGDVVVQSASSRTSDTLQSVDFDMKVLGSSAHINDFLSALNTAAPALNVRNFTLSPKVVGVEETATGEVLYEAKIRVAALYAPLAVVVDSLKPLPTLTKEEDDYVKTALSSYTIIPPGEVTQPATAEGKIDPFSL